LHLSHAGSTFGLLSGYLGLAVRLSGPGSLRPVNLNFRVAYIGNVTGTLGANTDARNIYQIAGGLLAASGHNMPRDNSKRSSGSADRAKKCTS
jgi:hypothetical protein